MIKNNIKDIILISAAVLLSVLALVLSGVFYSADAGAVQVWSNGQLETVLPLDSDCVYTTKSGGNVIAVHDGKAYMQSADCKDKLCVHQGKISKAGQTIICLPNKIVMELKGKKSGVDAVVG